MSTNHTENAEIYDVIVIGGGPSGMMAAGRAAEHGKRVLLIEKNKELGKKLSITGGGRCNITNMEFDIRALLAHYGEAADFLYSPFSKFGVQDTVDFFTTRGLPLKIEERKRAFPKTERATDVTRVMERYASHENVTVLADTAVTGFGEAHGHVTSVLTNRGEFHASSFVLSTGGRSHAHTGSTGEGIGWAKKLGHTTHESNPDLVPLITADAWVKNLSGKSLEQMKISFGAGKAKVVRTGRLLFTHFGLSGPTILNAAREVKKLLNAGPVTSTIDLFPNEDEGALRAQVLSHFNAHKNKLLRNVLTDILPPGMTDAVSAHVDAAILETKVHSITKEDRHRLVSMCKALPLTITGTMGFDWAIISDGGVDLHDVDTRTMASKKYPNLFFTGDVLHIPRPSGGFSLQLCWTTGWVAGSNA